MTRHYGMLSVYAKTRKHTIHIEALSRLVLLLCSVSEE